MGSEKDANGRARLHPFTGKLFDKYRDHIRHDAGQQQSEKQAANAVNQGLEVHYPTNALVGKPDGAQHSRATNNL